MLNFNTDIFKKSVVTLLDCRDAYYEQKAQALIEKRKNNTEGSIFTDVNLLAIPFTGGLSIIYDNIQNIETDEILAKNHTQNEPTKEEVKLHNTYANMAKQFFADGKGQDEIDGFVKKDTIENRNNGFASNVYYNKDTNDVVIIYQSTGWDDLQDIQSDLQMLGNKLPNQYEDAKKTYENVKKQYPNSNITVTGYSLGGSLAQLVASGDNKTKAVCFEPFGVVDIIKNNGLKDNDNCTNYVTDSSYVGNFKPQPGRTMTVEYNRTSNDYKNEDIIVQEFLSRHDISNFADLKNAKFKNCETEELARKLSSNETGILKYIMGFFA